MSTKIIFAQLCSFLVKKSGNIKLSHSYHFSNIFLPHACGEVCLSQSFWAQSAWLASEYMRYYLGPKWKVRRRQVWCPVVNCPLLWNYSLAHILHEEKEALGRNVAASSCRNQYWRRVAKFFTDCLTVFLRTCSRYTSKLIYWSLEPNNRKGLAIYNPHPGYHFLAMSLLELNYWVGIWRRPVSTYLLVRFRTTIFHPSI